MYLILLKVKVSPLTKHNNCKRSTLSGTASATIFIQGEYHMLTLQISDFNFTEDPADINVSYVFMTEYKTRVEDSQFCP